MKTSDLSFENIRALDDVAYMLYESKSGGATAVHNLASALGWEEYDICEPCDTEQPILDDCCLVCGSSRKEA